MCECVLCVCCVCDVFVLCVCCVLCLCVVFVCGVCGWLARFRIGFSRLSEDLSFEEREKKAAEVKNWTRKAPATSALPQITFQDIEAFHTKFSCVANAKKYLDKPDDLILMYAKKSTPPSKFYRVSLPRFWKKGQRRLVYVSYLGAQNFWALCSCTRKYVSFSLLFLILPLC